VVAISVGLAAAGPVAEQSIKRTTRCGWRDPAPKGLGGRCRLKVKRARCGPWISEDRIRGKTFCPYCFTPLAVLDAGDPSILGVTGSIGGMIRRNHERTVSPGVGNTRSRASHLSGNPNDLELVQANARSRTDQCGYLSSPDQTGSRQTRADAFCPRSEKPHGPLALEGRSFAVEFRAPDETFLGEVSGLR